VNRQVRVGDRFKFWHTTRHLEKFGKIIDILREDGKTVYRIEWDDPKPFRNGTADEDWFDARNVEWL
jgi:hypothetical protein